MASYRRKLLKNVYDLEETIRLPTNLADLPGAPEYLLIVETPPSKPTTPPDTDQHQQTTCHGPDALSTNVDSAPSVPVMDRCVDVKQEPNDHENPMLSYPGDISDDADLLRETKTTELQNEFSICTVCVHGFAYGEDLEKHLLSFHTNPSFAVNDLHTCEVCGDIFEDRNCLTLHLQSHDLTTIIHKYPQILTSLVLPNVHQGSESLVENGDVKQFASTEMNQVARGVNSSPHTQVKEYPVAEDSSAFVKVSDNQMSLCNEENPLSIAIEALSQISSEKYDTDEASGKPSYCCPECKKNCDSVQELRYHVRSHGFILCIKCGEHLPSHANLIEHAKVHTRKDEKLTSCYVCIKCGLALATAGLLLSHSELHKPIFEVACDSITQESYTFFKFLQIITPHQEETSEEFKEVICCPDCSMISVGKEAFGKHLLQKACEMNPAPKPKAVYPRRKVLRTTEDEYQLNDSKQNVNSETETRKTESSKKRCCIEYVDTEFKNDGNIKKKIVIIKRKTEDTEPSQINQWDRAPKPKVVYSRRKGPRITEGECQLNKSNQNVNHSETETGKAESSKKRYCIDFVDTAYKKDGNIKNKIVVIKRKKEDDLHPESSQTNQWDKIHPSPLTVGAKALSELPSECFSTYSGESLDTETSEKDIYSCPQCFEECDTVTELRYHVRSHGFLLCIKCGEHLPSHTKLIEHTKAHSMNLNDNAKACYACVKCGLGLATSQQLSSHSKLHKTVCEVACEDMTEEFYQLFNFLQIVANYKGETSGRLKEVICCPDCTLVSVGREAFGKHLIMSSCDIKKQPMCPSRKILKANREEELDSVPQEKVNLNITRSETCKERITCDVCSQHFPNAVMLRYHKSISCVPKKGILTFKCVTCRRKFKTVSLLKLHLQKHLADT